jgi:hypothetical protein
MRSAGLPLAGAYRPEMSIMSRDSRGASMAQRLQEEVGGGPPCP